MRTQIGSHMKTVITDARQATLFWSQSQRRSSPETHWKLGTAIQAWGAYTTISRSREKDRDARLASVKLDSVANLDAPAAAAREEWAVSCSVLGIQGR